jgi:hypothetical protein
MLMAIYAATYTLARYYARKAIEAERRALGRRHYSVKDAGLKARVYFTAHRAELLERATQVIENDPAFARWRSPEFPSGGQRRKRCSPSTIPVHISRPE